MLNEWSKRKALFYLNIKKTMEVDLVSFCSEQKVAKKFNGLSYRVYGMCFTL